MQASTLPKYSGSISLFTALKCWRIVMATKFDVPQKCNDADFITIRYRDNAAEDHHFSPFSTFQSNFRENFLINIYLNLF